MKLIGLMPVRNEEWCLGLTARAALMWCDQLVICLHACADRSWDIMHEICRENPKKILVMREADPTWHEMDHRQGMLEVARELMDATHIAIIDADEVLTGCLLPCADDYTGIKGYAFGCDQGSILQVPGYNLRCGINRYHSSGIWANRWFSSAFRDDGCLGWHGDKFHDREPHGVQPHNLKPYRPIAQGRGGVMHLWGSSERRLRAKSALYKITERLRWPSKPVADIERMYNWAIKGEPGHASHGTPDTWTYRDVPSEWWAAYGHLMKYLDVDAEPWQEAECRRLIAEHGRERFAGLDLFGVA